MDKSFPRHQLRKVHALDGLWQFAFLGARDAEELEIHDVDWNDRMVVPAAFDAMPAYAGKRGVAAYRRTISTSPEVALRQRSHCASILKR